MLSEPPLSDSVGDHFKTQKVKNPLCFCSFLFFLIFFNSDFLPFNFFSFSFFSFHISFVSKLQFALNTCDLVYSTMQRNANIIGGEGAADQASQQLSQLQAQQQQQQQRHKIPDLTVEERMAVMNQL